MLSFFIQLLPGRALLSLSSIKSGGFYDRLFTPLVTLWYLLFQRLNYDHTLQAVLKNAHAGGADALCPGFSRNIKSMATTAYSDARQRLPLAFLHEALGLQGGKIAELSPTTRWHGMVVALLDGTLVRLRPFSAVTGKFSRQVNQHKQPYWCLMRVAVCFCLLSGAALGCAMDACSISEQALASQIILNSLPGYLFMGDRNFGVFRIVQVARKAKAHVLLRLTNQRATRLLGQTLCLGDHSILWKPTRHDRCQPDCTKEPVQGRLMVVQLHRNGFRSQLLCLFTTLPDLPQYSIQELARLYGMRWHIELNIRYLKTQMNMVQLDVKSAEMAQKEWMAGLLAYNLIRAAQLSAALQKRVSPLTLSFSSVRRALEEWLLKLPSNKKESLSSWKQLLKTMGQCLLPVRKKPRPTEPRAQRHLRQPFPPLIGSRQEAREKLILEASKS